MQIGIFCARLSGNGPRTRTRTLLDGLGDRGHRVTLITGTSEDYYHESIDTRRIIEPTPWGLVRTARTVTSAFAGCDVVHVPINWKQVAFVRPLVDAPIVIGPGVSHDFGVRLFLRRLGVDHVIDTHEYVSWLWDVCGLDSTAVYPFVDRDRFHPRGEQALADGGEASKHVLYVGALTRQKGAHLVSGLACQLEREDIEVVVIGDGPLRDRFEGRSDCTYLGPMGNSELPRYYRGADVTVVPSASESFSLVALESAACGTPVVTTCENGTMRRLFEPRCAYYWVERSVPRFVDGVLEVLNNEGMQSALVDNSTGAIDEMGLTADDAIDETVGAYREVAGA